MRLFVALSLPEDVQQRLSGLANGLPGARWVKPENLHLTLHLNKKLWKRQQVLAMIMTPVILVHQIVLQKVGLPNR